MAGASGGNFKGYLFKHARSIETSGGQKDAAYGDGKTVRAVWMIEKQREDDNVPIIGGTVPDGEGVREAFLENCAGG